MISVGYMPDTHGGPYQQPEPDPERAANFSQQLLHEAEQAEQAGFDALFVPERHARTECMFPSTLTLMTALAARTERVKIGSYVIMPPLYHPVHLAEQAAMIDVLSRGRLIMGVGVGYHVDYFNHFGVSIRQREGRFEECLDILHKAWTTPGPVAHHGRLLRLRCDPHHAQALPKTPSAHLDRCLWSEVHRAGRTLGRRLVDGTVF